MTKEQFLARVGNWENHRNLLWPSLEAIKHLKLPVLELGCGMGSTEWLRQYCKDEGLEFFSYDSDPNFAVQYDSVFVPDWDLIPWRKEWGLVLVDEAPGEHRKISLSRLHHAKIVVAHDTEPAADHGYQMRAELAKYKFISEWETVGAWASVVSDHIDVSHFAQAMKLFL